MLQSATKGSKFSTLNEIAEAKTKRTKTADPLGMVRRSVSDSIELAAAEV